jgi:hypothetical protein
MNESINQHFFLCFPVSCLTSPPHTPSVSPPSTASSASLVTTANNDCTHCYRYNFCMEGGAAVVRKHEVTVIELR